mgnify:CR=1 FL=1
MKTYIIDTNALLSFVTDRNPKQQEKISLLFEQAGVLQPLEDALVRRARFFRIGHG